MMMLNGYFLALCKCHSEMNLLFMLAKYLSTSFPMSNSYHAEKQLLVSHSGIGGGNRQLLFFFFLFGINLKRVVMIRIMWKINLILS